ncbi:MAG: HlyC/CorC family transporter [Clostridia bacterium]|nr:HlyC/CorC family transporter [Clostridia bacterium]
MDSTQVTYLLVMFVCVVMSAYFSATETAFSSLNKTRIKALAEKGHKKAELARRLSDDYDSLLSTILIGNNIVNILLASIGTLFFVDLIGSNGATVSTIVITVVVLIFGEITPKSVAKDSPEAFAMFSAPFINFLIFAFKPLNFLFSLWKKLVGRIFKTKGDAKMSQEELLMFVEEVQQDGSVDSEEGDLLKNAIEFTDIKTEDILTHRMEIEAIDVNENKREISRIFSHSKFSRLPVYEESIDNIIGVVHQKDFYTEHGITGKSIREIMAPPIFVPLSEKIDDLLKVLKKHKSHIAIVLDEYGGTYGLVTMEDILEELVGEIWDEHDEVVESFHKIDNLNYDVDASENVDEFAEFFDLDLKTEIVTIGGWVADQLDRIPSVGDEFSYENLHIRVTETEMHRASKLKVTIVQPEDGEDEDKKEN